MASQMADAIFDTVGVDIDAKVPAEPTKYLFHASGRTVKMSGFLKVYEEPDEKEATAKAESQKLPALKEKDDLNLFDLIFGSSQVRAAPALQ